MKNVLKTSLLSLILLANAMQGFQNRLFSMKTAVITTVATTAAITSYRWLTRPLKVNSNLANLNILTFTPAERKVQGELRSIDAVCKSIQGGKGVENNKNHTEINKQLFDLSCQLPINSTETLYIYVSGYAGMSGNARYKYAGAGAHATYHYIRSGVIKNAPCISFDGQVNDRRTFNFGQQLDQDCLHEVVQETIRRNPHAKIVLIGSCKGGTTILNYLSNARYNHAQWANIKAVILESPSTSLEALTDQVARNHVPKKLQWLLPPLFKLAFPNYQWDKQNTIMENASKFPSHIPVLIGCLSHDKVASHEGIRMIVGSLRKAGKSVDLFEHSDTAIKHGYLAGVKEYQEKVASLLRTNGLSKID